MIHNILYIYIYHHFEIIFFVTLKKKCIGYNVNEIYNFVNFFIIKVTVISQFIINALKCRIEI